MTELIPHDPDRALSTSIAAAEDYARKSRAPNTMRGYRSDFALWQAWATARRVSVMPARPVDLAAWISDQAMTRKVGTLRRRLASLSVAHKLSGYPSPCGDAELLSVLAGIEREHGSVVHHKQPVLLDDLTAAVATCDLSRLEGLRDRAILCVAWSGALRRSEVADIDVEHLEWTDHGIIVTIPKSKTDRRRQGQRVTLPYAQSRIDLCPVTATADWVSEAGIDTGPLFRAVREGVVGRERMCGASIALVLKRRMRAAGIPGDWAGHSLRAGLVTQAAMEGVDVMSIAEQTRHRNLSQLQTYIRFQDPWRNNPATGAGL